jgi:hypothetical protein
LTTSEPTTAALEPGWIIWRTWRDQMLAQGREVAPERMEWATLPDRDKALDAAIEAEAVASLTAQLEQERAEKAALVERLVGWHDRHKTATCTPETCSTERLLADTAAASERWLAEVRRLVVEETWSPEQIAEALTEARLWVFLHMDDGGGRLEPEAAAAALLAALTKETP